MKDLLIGKNNPAAIEGVFAKIIDLIDNILSKFSEFMEEVVKRRRSEPFLIP